MTTYQNRLEVVLSLSGAYDIHGDFIKSGATLIRKSSITKISSVLDNDENIVLTLTYGIESIDIIIGKQFYEIYNDPSSKFAKYTPWMMVDRLADAMARILSR